MSSSTPSAQRVAAHPNFFAPYLFSGLVFYFLVGPGKFSSHIKELTNIDISDAALSERRSAVPLMVFEELLALALGPKGTEDLHPETFYTGLLLCGLAAR